jgi:hypothetical protein
MKGLSLVFHTLLFSLDNSTFISVSGCRYTDVTRPDVDSKSIPRQQRWRVTRIPTRCCRLWLLAVRSCSSNAGEGKADDFLRQR